MVDVSVYACRFAEVPAAGVFSEASLAAAILLQFTIELGTTIHRRIHGPLRDVDCVFDPEGYVPSLRLDRANPAAWNARTAFETWAGRFMKGLSATHDLLAERARMHLCQHPAAAVPRARLAREHAASESVIRRRFVDKIGETPVQYRARMRVAAAVPLLQKGWKVDAVAPTVGWKARKDLYRALRAVTGLSADDVRRLSDTEAQGLSAAIRTKQLASADTAAGSG